MTKTAWCFSSESLPRLVEFFVRNVGKEYISHAELQQGRAIAFDTWSPSLREVLASELAGALQTDPSSPLKIATVEEEGALRALALVRFNGVTKFAVLEDLVVDAAARGAGLGSELVDWVVSEARARGMRRVFLESGATNENAHGFFDRKGFKICSQVRVKEL